MPGRPTCHAAHDRETIHHAILETDAIGADPGSDLAGRIDPLSDDDWKEINSKIDRRHGGFFVSGVNQKVLPWRGEDQLPRCPSSRWIPASTRSNDSMPR